ncbi:hypothetical protein ES703_61012 [subsurface metagenome]
MSNRGAVLHYQHPAAGDHRGVFHNNGRGRLHDSGPWIDLPHISPDPLDALRRGGVHLVDHHHIGHSQVDLARVVGQLVTGAVGVYDGNHDIGLEKRGVVIAAIPQYDLPFLLGLLQDGLVVHPGVNDSALVEVGFVLLHLFYSAVVPDQVLKGGKPLDSLPGQVAIGHGVPDDHHLPAEVFKDLGHAAGGLALAAAGTYGPHGNHRPGGGKHGVPGAQQAESGPGGDHPGGPAHHVLVGHVGIGENRLVYLVVRDETFQITFGHDGNALRIEPARQFGGVVAALNVGYLGGREGDHLDLLVTPVQGVEVMEVAAGGPHDDNTGLAFNHINIINVA